MAPRHWLLALAVVCVVASGVGGTGAFSTVTADRGVSVSVVTPEDAYLGLSEPFVSTVPDGGSRADLLVVTNRLGSTLDLGVTVAETDASGGPNVTNVTVVPSLAPGESGPVVADLSCDSNATEAVTVAVDATGDGVRVLNASRTFDLTCG